MSLKTGFVPAGSEHERTGFSMTTLPITVATAHQPEIVQAATVLQIAERLYAMDPEWVVFFREVLGVDGVVRRTFDEPESLIRFECSPQYARIREMLDALRSRQQEKSPERESQRVVTVRMPRSLHETLKNEAGLLRVSVNTLCISKLMKLLDEQGRRNLGGTTDEAAEHEETGADL